LQNSIVDVTHFGKDDATDLEKKIYEDFTSTKNNAIKKIKAQLKYTSKTPGSKLSESLDGYLDYIFSMLKSDGVLNSETLDTTDSMYNKYVNDKISLSEFLIYAIKNNWIDLDVLNIGNDYYSSEEMFAKICDYVLDEITDDTAFDKKVYHVMVENGSISGRQICLLLFDQNVLKKNKTTYVKIQTGMISPYSFIKSKIRSLDISPGELGLTPCSCSVVITSVKSGKVLSLVSYPSYDNNKFANNVDSDYYAKISTSSASPLLNRATQQKAAPGSTFKMVTATTALEEGIITPNSTVYDGVTFQKINKPWPKCWSTYSHGSLTVSTAIQHSCNYFFYEMGYRLGNGRGTYVDNEKGLNRLKKYATMYGLTSTSGIELSESEPTFSSEDIVRSSIGQGTNSYTPVQMSRYVTTLANGKNCYDLTLVDRTKDTTTDEVTENSAKVKSELDISSSTLKAVKNGMYRVVNNGDYTSMFQSLPVKVAGKTGTAQITANEPNYAWFVSFAPYDNPEITVTVQIPNGYTSANAADLASKVYKYYFDKKSRKSLLRQKVSASSAGSGSQTD
jgi:penicillin-binding protein 2